MGKLPKSAFSGIGEQAKGILELIHSDVCGPMSIQARGGSFYFITFTADFSRFGWVYLMRYKFEAFDKFREFKNEMDKQSGKSIKTLRSDRGGEYLSTEFTQFLKDNGIIAQLTPPYILTKRDREVIDFTRSRVKKKFRSKRSTVTMEQSTVDRFENIMAVGSRWTVRMKRLRCVYKTP